MLKIISYLLNIKYDLYLVKVISKIGKVKVSHIIEKSQVLKQIIIWLHCHQEARVPDATLNLTSVVLNILCPWWSNSTKTHRKPCRCINQICCKIDTELRPPARTWAVSQRHLCRVWTWITFYAHKIINILLRRYFGIAVISFSTGELIVSGTDKWDF